MSYEEYLAWKELSEPDKKNDAHLEKIPFHVKKSLTSENPSIHRCGVCGQKIDQEVKN